MKLHKIILTDDQSLSIPGYEFEPVQDVTFHYDPTRITNEEVVEIVTLWEEDNIEENDNLEILRKKVDFFPDTSALGLSES
tara:strand:- start:99 stop:341 length:243 start_codon:yes stop_codon:yes gene_type:complete